MKITSTKVNLEFTPSELHILYKIIEVSDNTKLQENDKIFKQNIQGQLEKYGISLRNDNS